MEPQFGRYISFSLYPTWLTSANMVGIPPEISFNISMVRAPSASASQEIGNGSNSPSASYPPLSSAVEMHWGALKFVMSGIHLMAPKSRWRSAIISLVAR